MYNRTFPGPRETLIPSIASITALITCGEVSKIFGQTWLRRCINYSSQPKHYTPNAKCLTADEAVYLCTKSLSVKASINKGITAFIYE